MHTDIPSNNPSIYPHLTFVTYDSFDKDKGLTPEIIVKGEKHELSYEGAIQLRDALTVEIDRWPVDHYMPEPGDVFTYRLYGGAPHKYVATSDGRSVCLANGKAYDMSSNPASSDGGPRYVKVERPV